MGRWIFAIFVAVAALEPDGLLGQSLLTPAGVPPPIPVRLDPGLLGCVREYRLAADRYREGDVASSRAIVARLNRDDLKKVVRILDLIQALPIDSEIDWQTTFSGPNMRYAAFRWEAATLASAGMIHIDLALTAHAAGNVEDFRFHTDVASDVFVIADRPPHGSDDPPGIFGRRIARAMGYALLGGASIDLGREYIAAAAKRFPDDARVLLVWGTLLEAGGETVPRRFTADTDVRRVRLDRDQMLRDAARAFERALAADPSLLEARVRLARVYTLLNNDARAMPLLAEVLASSSSSEWGYLARLLLGAIHERGGRADEALKLYRAAVADRPRAQAGYLALSQLLYASGDGQGAAGVLEQLFAQGLSAAMPEPWWDYAFAPEDIGYRMLDALRAEVQR
jgi:hypothetical protein